MDLAKHLTSIGQLMVDLLKPSDRDDLVMLYADVEEGTIAADLVFLDVSGVVHVVTSPGVLDDRIFEFWEAFRLDDSPQRNPKWRAMTLVIRDQKFELSFQYPIDADSEYGGRRQFALQTVFGVGAVSYARFKELL